MVKKSVDLSRRVVSAIESYKGTLRGFSRESGIPYGSLFAYASGKKKPGLDALAAIVKVSGVSPVWLLTGEGDIRQHLESTKVLHLDAELLARIATELEMAWIRVGELNQDAKKAVLEALTLNDEKYYALVAKESDTTPADIKQRIDHTEYMIRMTAVIYNLVADIKSEGERSHRIRGEAYDLQLLRYTQDYAKKNSKRRRRKI